MQVLDLGTGSGYMTFPMAKRYGECKLIGLDIVSNALEANRTRAENEG